MKLLGACRLVDVLSEWGAHEARGRAGREVGDAFEGVEFALTCRAPLVARILFAGPIACVRGEIVAEDLPQLIIADGRLASDWATAVEKDKTRSGEGVRAWATAEQPIVGPLAFTCRGQVVDGVRELEPPFVIFDGWHRVAAWILHGRGGKAYPISVNLIVTQRPAPLLGQA